MGGCLPVDRVCDAVFLSVLSYEGLFGGLYPVVDQDLVGGWVGGWVRRWVGWVCWVGGTYRVHDLVVVFVAGVFGLVGEGEELAWGGWVGGWVGG